MKKEENDNFGSEPLLAFDICVIQLDIFLGGEG